MRDESTAAIQLMGALVLSPTSCMNLEFLLIHTGLCIFSLKTKGRRDSSVVKVLALKTQGPELEPQNSHEKRCQVQLRKVRGGKDGLLVPIGQH